MFFFNKPVLAQEQDGLLQLEAQGLRLDKLQRATIHLDQSLSALAISLLLEVSDDSVHCTMYNVQCTMYNVQCTMYNVHYACLVLCFGLPRPHLSLKGGTQRTFLDKFFAISYG